MRVNDVRYPFPLSLHPDSIPELSPNIQELVQNVGLGTFQRKTCQNMVKSLGVNCPAHIRPLQSSFMGNDPRCLRPWLFDIHDQS